MKDNEIRQQLIASGNIKTVRDVTATQMRKTLKAAAKRNLKTPSESPDYDPAQSPKKDRR